METEPLANTAGNDRGESLQNQEITAPKQKSSLLNKVLFTLNLYESLNLLY